MFRLLVLGGNGAEASLQMYKQGTGKWILLNQNLPFDLIGHSSTVFSDKYLYIRGGWHTRSLALRLEQNSTSTVAEAEKSVTLSRRNDEDIGGGDLEDLRELSFQVTIIDEDLPERMFPTMVTVPKRFFYKVEDSDFGDEMIGNLVV